MNRTTQTLMRPLQPSRIAFRLAQAWLCGALAIAATPASALDPAHALTQYGHTVWRQLDGELDGSPTTLTQTTDGYMWVGTTAGLFRFDGVRFEPIAGEEQARPEVSSLSAGDDGALWVGGGHGVTRWQGDQSSPHRLAGKIRTIVPGHDEDAWVTRTGFGSRATAEGKGPLCHVTQKETHCFDSADGIGIPFARALATEKDGSLWVASTARLIHWRHGAASETYAIGGNGLSEQLAGIDSIAIAGDGSLWVGSEVAGTGLGLQRFVDGHWRNFNLPGLVGSSLKVNALLIDREGALWVATSDDGLLRIFNGRAEHFRSTNGLSSNSVTTLFEDREGNLWVGTTGGLDRFRDLRVVSMSQAEGLSEDEVQSLFARRDGSVLVGNTNEVEEVFGDANSTRRIPILGNALDITQVFEDADQRLWVGVGSGLVMIDHGKEKAILTSDGKPLGVVLDIAQEDNGSIWVITVGQPGRVLRIDEDRVARVPAQPLPPSQRISAANGGGIWLATTDSALVRVRDGRMERFAYPRSTNNMFITGFVRAPGDAVYGGMAQGLVSWRDGKVRVLSAADGLPCSRVDAPALDRHHNLWLYMACGIVRVSAEDMDRWWAHPGFKLSPTLFDPTEGARPAKAFYGTASARSADGRLWFANGSQLQVIDPERIAGNRVIPPVHIESLVVNHQAFKPQADLHVGSNVRDLEIDYTALSFVAPQKVRFRYQLEGHDREWQDPGSRRQAFYTDLAPGRYTFRVIACNNDGIWNTVGDTLVFAVAPTFTQTGWFIAICVVAGLLAAAMIIRIRLTQLSAQIRVRIEERERIARELHDTLLQSVQAVMMLFHMALERMSQDVPGRTAMERAVDQADAATAEGRDRIQGLRARSASGLDLSQALEMSAHAMDSGATLAIRSVATGAGTLDAETYEELHRLGMEALRNTLKHARATKVDIEVASRVDALVVSLRDDGVGIAPQAAGGPGVPGHWGLQGMRERAARVGGRVEFLSLPGAGTEVRVTVPSARAYAARQSLWSRLLSRLRRS